MVDCEVKRVKFILNVIIDGKMSEEVQNDGSRNSASLAEAGAPGAECGTLDASTNVSQTTISQVTLSSALTSHNTC